MPDPTPIYLDHQATTPLDPAVLEAMLPFLRAGFGNAGSRTHVWGRAAAEAVEQARAQVAAAMGAEPRAVVFTSGATESINLALQGAVAFRAPARREVVTTRAEHAATLECCAALEAGGARVTRVGVDAAGRVDPDALAAATGATTALLSVLHANNEVGTVQDLAAIGARVRPGGAWLHVDAAQSLGKLPLDVEAMGIDLLSASAHKLYGPKGVGALYVRRREPRVRLQPLIHGGGQERGLRPGTLNVPGIVGFGAACALALQHRAAEAARLRALADALWESLRAALPDVQRFGDPVDRLPGNLSVGFGGVDANALLDALPDLALATGSACTSAVPRPSHVLRAMGVSPACAASVVRMGLGRFTTAAEVERASARLVEAVRAARTSPGSTGAACPTAWQPGALDSRRCVPMLHAGGGPERR